MSCDRTKPVGLMKSTIVLACLLGFGLGAVLGSLDAELWVYWVAGISMLPILLREFRHDSSERTRLRSRDKD